MFTSVLGTTESAMTTVTTTGFMWCTIASLVLGLASALIYMYRHDYSKNFVITLALLPVIVQMVITLVNGNLGAGVAVMGVFKTCASTLLAPVMTPLLMELTAGEIIEIDTIGMFLNILYVTTPFGQGKGTAKLLKITVPEDLEFEGLFDEVIEKYTSSFELSTVATSNMGSLYQLEYRVTLKQDGTAKAMIDELRCLNGNLKISLGSPKGNRETL